MLEFWVRKFDGNLFETIAQYQNFKSEQEEHSSELLSSKDTETQETEDSLSIDLSDYREKIDQLFQKKGKAQEDEDSPSTAITQNISRNAGLDTNKKLQISFNGSKRPTQVHSSQNKLFSSFHKTHTMQIQAPPPLGIVHLRRKTQIGAGFLLEPRSPNNPATRLGKTTHTARALGAIENKWAVRNLNKERPSQQFMIEGLRNIIAQSMDIASESSFNTESSSCCHAIDSRKQSKKDLSLKRKIVWDRKRPASRIDSGVEITQFRKQIQQTLKERYKCPKERLNAIHQRLRNERGEIVRQILSKSSNDSESKKQKGRSRQSHYILSPIPKRTLLPFNDRKKTLRDYMKYLNKRTHI